MAALQHPPTVRAVPMGGPRNLSDVARCDPSRLPIKKYGHQDRGDRAFLAVESHRRRSCSFRAVNQSICLPVLSRVYRRIGSVRRPRAEAPCGLDRLRDAIMNAFTWHFVVDPQQLPFDGQSLSDRVNGQNDPSHP